MYKKIVKNMIEMEIRKMYNKLDIDFIEVDITFEKPERYGVDFRYEFKQYGTIKKVYRGFGFITELCSISLIDIDSKITNE